MANISEFILPVLNQSTGKITMTAFNLLAGSPEGIGFGYGTCSTAYTTTAKTATLSGYNLIKNGMVAIKFTNAVNSNATLNINGKGAKAIYYKNAPIANAVINAGDTALFVYDGSYYRLLAIDSTASRRVSGTTLYI